MSLNYSLTDADIRNILPLSHFVLYSDIKDYDNVYDILGKHNMAVILLFTSDFSGHWICLFKRDNTLFFFDSYGGEPDSTLYTTIIPKKIRISKNQVYPELLKKMIESGLKIDYNPYQFQGKGSGISTCGRWCYIRLMHKEFDSDEFADFIFTLCEKYHITPDQLVLELTKKILKK